MCRSARLPRPAAHRNSSGVVDILSNLFPRYTWISTSQLSVSSSINVKFRAWNKVGGELWKIYPSHSVPQPEKFGRLSLFVLWQSTSNWSTGDGGFTVKVELADLFLLARNFESHPTAYFTSKGYGREWRSSQMVCAKKSQLRKKVATEKYNYCCTDSITQA